MNTGAPLRSTSDRLIVAGTVLLIGLAFILLIASWRYIDERSAQLTDKDLRSHVAGIDAQCDDWSSSWANAAHIESVWTSERDTISAATIVDRWRTLMDAYWPVVAVRLADENGNEIALIRHDSTLVLRETAVGSINGPPFVTVIEPARTDSAEVRTWIDSLDQDPREQAWFGQALRNRAVDPVWTMAEDGSGAMCLAQLVRPTRAGQPYRILEFTIAPSRSGTAILGHLRQGGQWSLLLFPNDHLITTSPSTPSGVDSVLSQALTTWRATRAVEPFTLQLGGTSYRCWIKTHQLNGVQLLVGSIVSHRPQEDLVRTARVFVVVGLVLMGMLTALLLAAYVRKRRDLLRLRTEQERTTAQQQRLIKALGERDVLDRETHHRVKNNLQVVSSLLNLQAQRLDDGPVKDEFLRGKQRIDTMALVHHKLYGLPDLRGVDLFNFFEDLARSMKAANDPHGATVSCSVDTAGLRADTDSAIELGIILCELVSNCYLHAFPYATGGHIDISVQHVERDMHRLIVKDNGVGMGSDGARGKAKLGLEIVDALAGQLDGSFNIRSNGGVTFEVLFRMAPAPVEG